MKPPWSSPRSRTRFCVTLAVLCLVVSTRAATVGVPLGSDAPPEVLGGIPVIAFPPDLVRGYQPSLFMDVDNAPGHLGSVQFGALHNHRRVGEGWNTWSHGYAGDVYYTNGALSSTLTLPAGTRAFIFYVGVESPAPVPVTAVTDDGILIRQEVSTASGFGFYGTEGTTIRSITITAPVPFAVGEFAQSTPPPELHVTLTPLGNCCWKFDLGQYAGVTGDITEITVQVNTPGVSIVSAGPACGSGPAPSVTPTSVVWQVPTGLVATYPNYAPTCAVQICFQAPAGQVISLTFTGSGGAGGGGGGEPPPGGGSPPGLTQNVELEGPGCSQGPQYPTGCNYLYTLDADFDKGTLLSVNHDSPNNDQLQINNPSRPLPYLIVAASGRGTLIRIDVNTGQVLGEYLSAPVANPDYGRNPSRTTVDLYGNAWAGNRDQAAPGSVVKIGLCVGGVRGNRTGTPGNYVFTPDPNGHYVLNPSYSTCIDRDGDGLIKTSRGLGDILPWTNVTDGDGGGISGPNALGGPALVQDAEDEAILIFQRVNGGGVRSIQVDENNDVWVGANSNHMFDKLDGNTGAILATVTATCGGYGGLINCDGKVWSSEIGADSLWYYDPVSTFQTCLNIPSSYGLGVDNSGFIWNTSFAFGQVYRINPATLTLVGGFPVSTFGWAPRGVAITPADDHAWIANSGSNTVVRLDNSGTLQGAPIPVAGTPTGVSVDTNGKIWVSNISGNSVMRIKPVPAGSGAVDLTVPLGMFPTPADPNTPLGAYPYNYSDMTGMVALNATAGQGSWDVIQDSGNLNQQWGKITWNTEPQGFVPPGAAIIVQARASNTVAGLGSQSWLTVTNGVPFSLTGRYIEVRATLKAAAPDPNQPCLRVGPVLSDLRIECCGPVVRLLNERILCKCPAGSGYDWSFVVQNLTGAPLGQLFFYSQTPGVTIAPTAVTFSPPIPPNGTSPVVTLSATGPGAVPGASVCVLIGQTEGSEGCGSRHCFTLPTCGCVQLIEPQVTCLGPNTYQFQFRIANTWGQPIAHVLLIDDPNAPVATFNPAYFAVSLPTCASLSPWLQTTITSTPAFPLQFRIVVLTPEGNCCMTPVEVTLPDWGVVGRCCYEPCRPNRYRKTKTVCSEAECAALGGVFFPNPQVRCTGCWPIDWVDVVDILPIGWAGLVGDESPGGTVEVNDLGLSGQDGVRVQTTPAATLAFDWGSPDPFGDLPEGAYLEARGYGRCAGQLGRLMAALRGTVVPNGVRLDADFSPVGASAYQLQLYSAGVLVLDRVQSGPVGVAETWPQVVEFVALSAPAISLSWFGNTTVMIPGHGAVVGDYLVLTAVDPDITCAALLAAEVTGAGLSGFTLYGVQVGPVACAGDTNCDGVVSYADIDNFVDALAGENAWTHGPCPWLSADTNGDGRVTYADIDPFLARIGTDCP